MSHKEKSTQTVQRILELCRAAVVNQNGLELYKGLMFALTILFEEHTGRYLHKDNVKPQDVMEWAERVKRTGEL